MLSDRISGHAPTHNMSLYVVPTKEVPFGGQKDEICNLAPIYLQKRKNWAFKLAVNGKL